MTAGFNLEIFNFLNGLAGQFWPLDYLGFFFADYLGYFLVLAAAFPFLREPDWRRRFYFFSLVVLSIILSRGIVTEIVRFFYPVPRPFLADSSIAVLIDRSAAASFPSGHAAFYFALGAAVFFLNRKWGGAILAGAVLMGIARVFAGVHWPLDVLGGALAGVLCALAAWKIVPRPPLPRGNESVSETN